MWDANILCNAKGARKAKQHINVNEESAGGGLLHLATQEGCDKTKQRLIIDEMGV